MKLHGGCAYIFVYHLRVPKQKPFHQCAECVQWIFTYARLQYITRKVISGESRYHVCSSRASEIIATRKMEAADVNVCVSLEIAVAVSTKNRNVLQGNVFFAPATTMSLGLVTGSWRSARSRKWPFRNARNSSALKRRSTSGVISFVPNLVSGSPLCNRANRECYLYSVL